MFQNNEHREKIPTGAVAATAAATATTASAPHVPVVASAVAVPVAAPAPAALPAAPTTTASAPVPAAASVVASSTSTRPAAGIGLLPVPKTITVTFVPDWSQDKLNSPLRSAAVCVVLGPANTTPEQAPWVFEFNLYATDKAPKLLTKDEETIPKGSRALLWYEGKAFGKYKDCVAQDRCKLLANDELRTHSIVVKTHGAEQDANALVYVRERKGLKPRKDLSYLKVVLGKCYYLNITFAAGSTIAERVGAQSWRPIIYLLSKRQKRGIDEVQSSLLFSNFKTNWLGVTEACVNERELKAAEEAVQRDAAEDEANEKAMTKDAADNSSVAPIAPAPSLVPLSVSTAPGGLLQSQSNSYGWLLPYADTYANQTAAVCPEKSTPVSLATRAFHPMLTALVPPPPHAAAAAAAAATATAVNYDLVANYTMLERLFNSKPLSGISLAPCPLASQPFTTDFSLDPMVDHFVNPEESTLAPALCAIEGVARTMAADSKSPYCDVAKHVLNCFSAVSQLPGWQHVQNFIANPQLYIERAKSAQKGDEIAAAGMTRGNRMVSEGSIDELQTKGQLLIQRLCQRIDWVLTLQRKATQQFNAEFYIKVIAVDKVWADDASAFMKEAETKTAEMLTKNALKFHAFRELQRKGVRWPHSAALRREIERAGFVFRPMMIKRDRCVCETCGVEVFGWRPWHNPWSFHNYARHPPSFLSGAAVNLQSASSPLVAQMVTQHNLRSQPGDIATKMADMKL